MCEVRLVGLPSGGRRNWSAAASPTSPSASAASASPQASAQVFEQMTRTAPLPHVLGSVTVFIESAGVCTLASVSVLEASGRAFASMVAPELPAGLRACARARQRRHPQRLVRRGVYLGRQVLVADVWRKDPFWLEPRAAAQGAGLQAAWSTPIKAAGGRCSARSGSSAPSRAAELARGDAVMARAAQLAGIAIERRLGEEALRSSEAKFRGLFESIAEGVYQSGRDGRLLSVNPRVRRHARLPQAPRRCTRCAQAAALYWDPADRAEFARRVDSEGEIRDAEFLMRRRDGQQIVVLENARPMCDAAGRHIGYEGTIANITERKRAEQAIFAEKERAQVTLESIGDAVISTDADGRIEYINPVAERLTAWSLAEARGQPIGAVLNLVNETHPRAGRELLDGALGRGGRSRRRAISRCSSRAPGTRSRSRSPPRRSATARARSSARWWCSTT